MVIVCFYMFCPIFAPLQPHKTTFAAVFYICMCVRTLYIGETPKSVLFAVCSRLPVLYVC
jgi:hypothetical protein